jgi:hypothetical protein
MAIFALGLSIAGVLLYTVLGPFIGGVELLAVFCAHSARSDARKVGRKARTALAALVIGYFGLALAPLYFVFFVLAMQHMS